MAVGDEPFQSADRHRLEFDSERAFAFALRLLRANPSAYRGKGRRTRNNPIRPFVISFLDFRNKIGNLDIDGAARNARSVFTVQTAVRLRDCNMLRITEGNFFKIFCAFPRILRGHFVLIRFNRHVFPLPALRGTDCRRARVLSARTGRTFSRGKSPRRNLLRTR